MNILEKALQKTIKAVGEDRPQKSKLKKCGKCGHWFRAGGESEINHKRFCPGK